MNVNLWFINEHTIFIEPMGEEKIVVRINPERGTSLGIALNTSRLCLDSIECYQSSTLG